jgi:hypothetical protein
MSVAEVSIFLDKKYGVKISYEALKKFEQRNQPKIADTRRDADLAVGDLGISYKRNRLMKLAYLLNDRLEIYSQSHERADSMEIRGILEQARREVEGDKLKIDISGRIDIEASVKNEIEELMLKNLTINQIILSRVCARLGVPTMYLQERLTNSFYSKFNGFRKSDLTQEVEYPSAVVYDFNAIQIYNEAPKQIESNSPTLSDEVKVEIIEKKLSLKELIAQRIQQSQKLITPI